MSDIPDIVELTNPGWRWEEGKKTFTYTFLATGQLPGYYTPNSWSGPNVL
jgi:hypothetical protein